MGPGDERDKRDERETDVEAQPEPQPEAQTRGLIYLTFHNAAREMFGDTGLRAVGAKLPAPTRAATVDEVPLSLAWYPTRFAVEWYDAVLEAKEAAAGDVARFHAWLHRTTDLGFGRIRRTLLGLFGPEALVSRAGELWRHDHSTGTLEVTGSEPNAVSAVLRDHPYLTTHIGQTAITETIRDILSRARGVRARRVLALDGGRDALHFRFTWE